MRSTARYCIKAGGYFANDHQLYLIGTPIKSTELRLAIFQLMPGEDQAMLRGAVLRVSDGPILATPAMLVRANTIPIVVKKKLIHRSHSKDDLKNLSKLKKDNTGYDLRNLFIGSEGTLGVITAAVLKLHPRPRSVATAFVGMPSPKMALEFLTLARGRGGGMLTSFELIADICVEPACAMPPASAHR